MAGICRARCAGVFLACAVSATMGVALVFRLLPAVQRLSTAELIGVLGLLIMPGLTAMALFCERQARRGRAAAGAAGGMLEAFEEQPDRAEPPAAWEAVWAAVAAGEPGAMTPAEAVGGGAQEPARAVGGGGLAVAGVGGAGGTGGAGRQWPERRAGADAGSRRGWGGEERGRKSREVTK